MRSRSKKCVPSPGLHRYPCGVTLERAERPRPTAGCGRFPSDARSHRNLRVPTAERFVDVEIMLAITWAFAALTLHEPSGRSRLRRGTMAERSDPERVWEVR
jgi:hypothetical protein